MAITTTCSGCGKTLAVADEYAGRQARCPQCGQIYTVPPVGSSAPSPAGGPLGGATAGMGGGPGAFPEQSPLDFGGTQAASSASPNSTAASGDQFWMKANDGREYGPVDNATLSRWFSEGRVGPGYQIRAGETGLWQAAASFQSGLGGSSTTNPYASVSSFPTGGTVRQYPKSDQSGLVLAMGILSWIVCPICGVIAWVMGGQALKDMQQGTADPTNRGLVQVGYYLGMVNVILAVCCVGFYIVIVALVAIGGNL